MQMTSTVSTNQVITTNQLQVSILIPVYRNEGGLEELVVRIEACMKNSVYADSFELILVDDCSPDNSWQMIQKLATNYAFAGCNALKKFWATQRHHGRSQFSSRCICRFDG